MPPKDTRISMHAIHFQTRRLSQLLEMDTCGSHPCRAARPHVAAEFAHRKTKNNNNRHVFGGKLTFDITAVKMLSEVMGNGNTNEGQEHASGNAKPVKVSFKSVYTIAWKEFDETNPFTLPDAHEHFQGELFLFSNIFFLFQECVT